MSTQQPPRPKRRRVDSTCVKETTQAKQPHPPAASTSSAPASTNQQQLFSSTKTDVVTSTPSRQYTCNRDVDYSRMALLLHAAIQPTPTASPTTPTYPYGNYHAYYGYRLASAFEEDARLKVLHRNWFAHKDVLDVGCNEGLVTIALAAKFGCRSTLGIDLDHHLVKKATRNLINERAAVNAVIHDHTRPLSVRNAARRHMTGLLYTSFKHADFVHMHDAPCNSYDVVLALSITKWVHVNWGDAGLVEFFRRLVAALRPGGLLVLEPQPWRSYKQIRHKSNTKQWPHVPLHELTLRPEGFADLLTSEDLGLVLVKSVQETHAKVEGFRRPMLVLQKKV